MSNSELLELLQHLMRPKPMVDPAEWDALLADVDRGMAHE